MAQEKFNPIAKLPMLPGTENVVEPEPSDNKKTDKKKLLIIRVTIVTILAALILVGILLTLNFVPRMASDISQHSKSFFVTQTASSTPTKKTEAVKTKTATTSAPKIIVATPAKLVVNMLSTDAINNRMIVRFDVKNIGGSPSGRWSFYAKLPSRYTPNYYSPIQNPIAPQNGVIYTLEFNADQDLPVQIILR